MKHEDEEYFRELDNDPRKFKGCLVAIVFAAALWVIILIAMQ